MNQDLAHLRLLAIFHSVAAALLAVFACFPLIHFFVGLAMFTGLFGDDGAGAGEAELVGVFFMVLAAVFILTGWTVAVLVFFAGRCLAGRTRYTFCLAMGGVECLFMPEGTVLGVFTLIVLLSPGVRELFAGQGPPPGGGGGWAVNR